MAQKGDLLSVREDIRVVDATIRDGGLCNNFEFPDEFVKALYKANVKAGVDYMEFGYKASKELFNEKDFGKWKFCNDDDIREIVGENNTDLKIAVMADVGRTDFKNDILPKNESPIDLVRIATYINTIPAAVEMIEDCAKKGYETTINIMAVSKARTEDIITALDILGKSPVNAFYIVDSYGALYPEEARKLAELYCSYGEKYGKSVGIHAHNNQQLAFANTIEAMTQGVSYLDATVDGMGRGAGNCALELLLGFLKNPKYKVDPILKMLEYTQQFRESGVKWGYDVPYMLTGQYIRQVHCSMRSAVILMLRKSMRTSSSRFVLTLPAAIPGTCIWQVVESPSIRMLARFRSAPSVWVCRIRSTISGSPQVTRWRWRSIRPVLMECRCVSSLTMPVRRPLTCMTPACSESWARTVSISQAGI